MIWNGAEHLHGFFLDFLLAGTFQSAFDVFSMPLRWRQAQTILSGARLQLELRGHLGAAAMTKWT